MSASARLSIDAIDPASFDVATVEGRERLSAPYRFDVTATTRDDEGLVLRQAIGRRARLQIEMYGVARAWSGVVASVRALGRVQEMAARGGSRPVYRIRIVEATWLLRHRITSRIFQDLSVPEVIRAVLAEHRITARFALERGYPAREYVTQYRETDLAFVQRLMGEAGLFCRAIAAADDAALVDDILLGDTPRAYEALSLPGQADGKPASLFFLAVRGTAESGADKVTAFEVRSAVRTSSALHRDFDPERPLTPLESSAAMADPPVALEAYEHGADFLFPKWAVAGKSFGEAGGQRALEQHRRRASIADGRGSCVALAPGRRFALEAHTEPDLNREWTAIDVRHRLDLRPDASSGVRYENRFECVPSDVAYPARRPERRPAHVAETGTVVGPPGEEIHVDSKARVRVHFHWDRRGPTETSSCWLRTMQTWSGPGWGSQLLPRVGMEVIVLFEGGDPDRPLVIGTVNNALNPPPYPLPELKARSGIKSRSTPSAEGFNELFFDDSAGQEVLSLHAQRNLEETTLHDRHAVIGHDRETTVQGSSREEVHGNRTRFVRGDESVTIAGASSVAFTGARSETATKDVHVTTGGDRVWDTKGSDRSEIHGDRSATMHGSDHVVAEVARSVVVGTPDAQRGDALAFVWGTSTQRTTKTTEIIGDQGITLRSGKSTLEILPDRIRISGPLLEIEGKESVSVRGDGAGGPVLKLSSRAEILADEIHLRSESARLSLKKNASLKGDKVLLNSDDAKLDDGKSDGARPEPRKFAIRLFDEAKEPYADKSYSLVLGSATFEGKTDGKGRVSAEIPAGATTGRIIVWKDAYPTGPTEEWSLTLDTVGPAGSPRELQKRLANLGFDSGSPVDELSPRLREALRAFQAENRIGITGEPDEDTLALLHIIHP